MKPSRPDHRFQVFDRDPLAQREPGIDVVFEGIAAAALDSAPCVETVHSDRIDDDGTGPSHGVECRAKDLEHFRVGGGGVVGLEKDADAGTTQSIGTECRRVVFPRTTTTDGRDGVVGIFPQ